MPEENNNSTTGADIGLIGLAVMGQNLVLNMADNGFRVAAYNRTTATTDEFAAGPAAEHVKNSQIIPTSSLEELVGALAAPRKVMLMVKAGSVVDYVIEDLVPLLDEGDIIIDGGNSLYSDTERRVTELAEKGLRYVGAGVSGGELGARFGPSIMPGGPTTAREFVEPIFQKISAKANDGQPCSAWLGTGGSGHFVKMVHNGIEYGDMQVLAEAYSLLKASGMDTDQMAAVFTDWKDSPMASYLVDITADILAKRDDDGTPVIDLILDAAGQKGTGRWTVVEGLEHGQPLSLVAEAVMARQVSSMVELRAEASTKLTGPSQTLDADTLSVEDIQLASFGAKVISYAQGFMLLREASKGYGWDLDLGTVAAIWRGGCIIRADFLDDITRAYRSDADLDNLLFDQFFTDAMSSSEQLMRRVIAAATTAGIPVPAIASALSFYDGMRSKRISANLVQAQRDYFGAHTYERVDKPRGEHFHTDWTGTGGKQTSTSYDA